MKEKIFRVKGLTEDEFKAIKRAAWFTWQAIGSDCEACVGKPLSMTAMVEVVIDADHILFYGGGGNADLLDKELYQKFQALSYSTKKRIVRAAL